INIDESPFMVRQAHHDRAKTETPQRARAVRSRSGCLGQFVYNEVLRSTYANRKRTMSIQRHHVGKRLANMVVHAGTIYLAGQVADDLSADITTQAKQVLAQIDRLLGEAGSNKSRILSATIYLPDMNDFAAMNAVWEA